MLTVPPNGRDWCSALMWHVSGASLLHRLLAHRRELLAAPAQGKAARVLAAFERELVQRRIQQCFFALERGPERDDPALQLRVLVRELLQFFQPKGVQTFHRYPCSRSQRSYSLFSRRAVSLAVSSPGTRRR